GSASHFAYYYRAVLARTIPGSLPVDGYLRQALEVDPGFAPAYSELAHAKGADPSQIDEAVALMKRATELDAENSGYWVDLSRFLLRANHRAEALAAAEHGRAVARSTASRRIVEAWLQELDK